MTAYRPLAGVRVLSFEVAASLPAGTRTLADLGADAVRVAEPPTQANPYIRVFDSSLINKQSIVLDLRRTEGRALALRLADAADVVCSNFRPHVLPQFGLDYTSLRARKPGIIVLQLSGFGTPGPWQDFPAYGPNVEAAGGLNALMGEPDELPQRVGGGVFADTLAGRYAALAICAALLERDATGQGQYLDLSMYECIVAGLGDRIMRAAAEGHAPARMGNRSERAAPQGVYPCKDEGGRMKDEPRDEDGGMRDERGPRAPLHPSSLIPHPSDAWVAISVVTDAQFRALAEVMGRAEMADDARFSTTSGRRANHDALDAVISEWTCGQTKEEASALLQARGVPAGPVQKTGDVPVDVQHRARGFFQKVRHREPILGYQTHPHMRMPAAFAGHARKPLSDHHAEGGTAAAILRRWLGSDAEEVRRLHASGAFGEARPVVPPGTPLPGWFGARAAERHADFGARLGLERADADGTDAARA